jgi:hypothetical protein
LRDEGVYRCQMVEILPHSVPKTSPSTSIPRLAWSAV